MSDSVWTNKTANDVVTISGTIQNDTVRLIANAVNFNAQILKDVLNRLADLEKASKAKAEGESKT